MINAKKQFVSILNKYIKNKKISSKIVSDSWDFSLEYCKNESMLECFIVPIFEDKINDIIYNLNHSEKFLYNILHGKYKSKKIPNLSSVEMNPVIWSNIMKKIEFKDSKSKNINTTDKYTCSKCGEKKHTFMQLQTRSADEPITTIYTCVCCSKSFNK